MIKRFLICLVLLSPLLATAQRPQDRLLGLTTQDKNGLFMVVVIATPNDVRASVRQFSAGHSGGSETSPYSRERFEELWLTANSLGLTRSTMTANDEIGASKNYVITIGKGDTPSEDIYLVPKCSASPVIVTFVKRLTEGLLPPGSPGLFRPCPKSSNRTEG